MRLKIQHLYLRPSSYCNSLRYCISRSSILFRTPPKHSEGQLSFFSKLQFPATSTQDRQYLAALVQVGVIWRNFRKKLRFFEVKSTDRCQKQTCDGRFICVANYKFFWQPQIFSSGARYCFILADLMTALARNLA